MKVERSRGNNERRILTGMITDPIVLSRVSSIWETNQEFFKSKWANTIAEWCIKYFNKHGKAPNKSIVPIFQNWARRQGEDKRIDIIERFLEVCSAEYDQSNYAPEYLVDLAGNYFNEVKLMKLADSIHAQLDLGRGSNALDEVNQFSNINMGKGSTIDVLLDHDAVKAAITEERKSIVKYPGALGEFFGDDLEREGFVCFMGPEKRGKSYWLMDLAWRAMLQRLKVAFFECGDMSQNQLLRRMVIRASKRPLKPKIIFYPKKMYRDEEGDFVVVKQKRRYKTGVSWQKACQAFEKIQIDKVRSKKSRFKLSSHSTDSLSVDGMRAQLRTWEREEQFVPDVIIADYADILAPPTGIKEPRDQVNKNWKQLRAMSQDLHCLVVTATQTDATSYEVDSLSMKHFSEDKRKFGHVTGMIGLNQSPDEKQKGILRLNWVVLREDEFSIRNFVHVAECRGLANPCVLSSL